MAGGLRLFATAHPSPELPNSLAYCQRTVELDDESLWCDCDKPEIDVDPSERYTDPSRMDVDSPEVDVDASRMDVEALEIGIERLMLVENKPIKRLRLDKAPGLVPPYCATAPAYCACSTHKSKTGLGVTAQPHGPSPLRNIAISNIRK